MARNAHTETERSFTSLFITYNFLLLELPYVLSCAVLLVRQGTKGP